MPRNAARVLFSSGNQRTMQNNQPRVGYEDDLEAATPKISPRRRFRDAINEVIEDNRRERMGKKLRESVDRYNLEKYRKSDDELKEIKDKKIRRFYEEQNNRLNDWLEVDAIVYHLSDDILDSFDPHDVDGDGIPDIVGDLARTHENIEPHLPEEERKKRQKNRKTARLAININVVANIALLAAKIVAALFSSSLSLIASLVDSALDLLCTVIVWTTNRLVAWKIKGLQKRFPIGRRRLEPLGILVFSVIMIVSFIQILQESVMKLLPSGDHEAKELPAMAIFAMLSTVVVKGIIWIGCARIKTTQVQALAQDCKTDVIFNTLSLLFPLIGAKAHVWWLDPVGAGLLSIYIIYDWASTCLENVARLTGIGVDDHMLKKIMYLCYRFAPIVDSFKSVTAYHAGDGVWVEVDLLMDQKTSLEHTHDVAETLQYCLEALAEVDRAFVTVDYAKYGPSGHAHEESG